MVNFRFYARVIAFSAPTCRRLNLRSAFNHTKQAKLCQSSVRIINTLTNTAVIIVFTLHFTVIQHAPATRSAFVPGLCVPSLTVTLRIQRHSCNLQRILRDMEIHCAVFYFDRKDLNRLQNN